MNTNKFILFFFYLLVYSKPEFWIDLISRSLPSCFELLFDERYRMKDWRSLDAFNGFDAYNVSLGDILRGERATLGKSYFDVQEDLKIKSTYIEAIENCDLESLNNYSFITGYVRTYAKYLKLDAEVVFEQFCLESGYSPLEGANLFKKKIKPVKKIIQKEKLSKTINGWSPGLVQGKEFSMDSIVDIGLKVGPLFTLILVIFGVGFWSFNIIKDLQKLEIGLIDQSPYVTSSILTEFMKSPTVEQVSTPKKVASFSEEHYSQGFFSFYSTQELPLPVVSLRDGPISSINPENEGIFQKGGAANISSLSKLKNIRKKIDPPIVSLQPEIPNLQIYALEAAWLRIVDKLGQIVFEKTMSPGERFLVTENLFTAALRVGNAKKVFLILNGEVLGPIGQFTDVVKNFKLDPRIVKEEVGLSMLAFEELELQELVNEPEIDTAKRVD